MPVWVQAVVALGGVLGLGTGIGSPFFIRAQLKKFKSDSGVSEATAAETIQKSATALLQPAVERAVQLQIDLTAANAQVFRLTVDVASANAEVASLRNQVDSMSKELTQAYQELEVLRGGSGGPTSQPYHKDGHGDLPTT
jgi:capsule polysaccharide export protein KpsE/RkpR